MHKLGKSLNCKTIPLIKLETQVVYRHSHLCQWRDLWHPLFFLKPDKTSSFTVREQEFIELMAQSLGELLPL
jgi:hypothetical protein